MSEPIAPESPPAAEPAAKPARKAATPPAPPVDASAVQYASAYLKEAGVRVCPECGADLRSLAAHPGKLSCPYGHHQEDL